MNELKTNFAKNILLGENAYSSVMFRINEIIKNAQASTIEGSSFLDDMYKTLNESITPLLSLKPFITKGEEFAGDDKTVCDVVKSVKKNITDNADINFLINMCKEEHFANMLRSGHPSPENTIEDIKKYFERSSSETEKNISKGLFDSLESNLLGEIKKDLGYSENEPTTDKKELIKIDPKDLKESDVVFNGNFAKYHPIGVLAQDTGNNYAIIEDVFFKLNSNNEDMEIIQNEDNSVTIPEEFLKISEALNKLVYDPESQCFEPSCEWDFDIKLNVDGNVTVNDKPIDPEKVQDLFVESINSYNEDPTLEPKYEPGAYMNDADLFVLLTLNNDLLCKFDNIEVVRDLTKINESVMYNINTLKMSNKAPRLIKWTQSKESPIFESYIDLCDKCDKMFEQPSLFESIFFDALNEEKTILDQRSTRLTSLNESQKVINKELSRISSLKSMSEENSPTINKLNEMEEKLNNTLNNNISEMKNLMDNKFYYTE